MALIIHQVDVTRQQEMIFAFTRRTERYLKVPTEIRTTSAAASFGYVRRNR